jgi:hypothetical protein
MSDGIVKAPASPHSTPTGVNMLADFTVTTIAIRPDLVSRTQPIHHTSRLCLLVSEWIRISQMSSCRRRFSPPVHIRLDLLYIRRTPPPHAPSRASRCPSPVLKPRPQAPPGAQGARPGTASTISQQRLQRKISGPQGTHAAHFAGQGQTDGPVRGAYHGFCRRVRSIRASRHSHGPPHVP